MTDLPRGTPELRATSPHLAILTPELAPALPETGALERLAIGWASELAEVVNVSLGTFLHHRIPQEADLGSFSRVMIDPSQPLTQLRAHGITHVVIHNRPHWLDEVGLPGFVVLHSFDHAWTSPSDPYPPRDQRLRGQVYAVSKALADHATRHHETGNEIGTILPWVEDSFDQPRNTDQPSVDRLLFPNRISPRKGVRETLQAMELAGVEVDFVENIAPNERPTDLQDELLRAILATPGSRIVPRTGHPNETAALYRSYRAIIMPSTAPEGLGMVAAEAAVAGVAFGASAQGGLTQLAHGYGTELHPSEPARFAQELTQLASASPPSEAQRQRAARTFSRSRSLATFRDALGTIGLDLPQR